MENKTSTPKITKEQLAQFLNGREYAPSRQISKEEELLAKEDGLVILFGYSGQTPHS